MYNLNNEKWAEFSSLSPSLQSVMYVHHDHYSLHWLGSSMNKLKPFASERTFRITWYNCINHLRFEYNTVTLWITILKMMGSQSHHDIPLRVYSLNIQQASSPILESNSGYKYKVSWSFTLDFDTKKYKSHQHFKLLYKC